MSFQPNTFLKILFFCTLVSLCPSSSYGAMLKTREIQKELPKRNIFLKKYRGSPTNGYLIADVPFYKQKSRNYCGPAVLSMVINYWQKGNSIDQEEIVCDIYQSDEGITNNSDMVFYPRDLGFLTYSFHGKLDKLKELISRDIPVIILQQVIGPIRKGHYRVVIGYDEEKEVVIVHDPLLGEKLAISYSVFLNLWDFGEEINKKNWALIVLPKEKRSILDELPPSAINHHNLATALYNRGRIQEAIEEWKKSIRADSKDATAYYCIAYAYIKEKNFDEAIHYAQLAVELDNDNSFCYDTLGWAYYHAGRLQDALKYLDMAKQMQPKAHFIEEHYQTVQQKINAVRNGASSN